RVCLRVEARGHQGRKLIVLHRMGSGGRHPGRSGLRLWLLRLTSAVFACLHSLHPFHRRRQGLDSRDEGMPERLAGRDTKRRVVVQHAQDQVHKDLVVGDLVTRIVRASALRPPCVHADDLRQPRFWGSGLFPGSAALSARPRSRRLEAPLGCTPRRGLREAFEERVARRRRRLFQHGKGGKAEHLHQATHLIVLVRPAEERLPRVHFHQDAAQRPHVDSHRVREAEHDLGRAVEAGLYVGIHALVAAAGGAKVDQLDPTPLGVAQQNVLGFEVAVDDVHVWAGQEVQGLEDLLGELPEERERDPGELGVLEEVVEIVGEHLEDQDLVVPVDEVLLQAHHVEVVRGVHLFEGLQEIHLCFRLHHEGLAALDDLHRHLPPRAPVQSSHHLPERTLADPILEYVPVPEDLLALDNVVVVLVVP
ncbi:dual-specificity tyrosine- -phosphorylation regulated kinase 1b, partial [Nannochloropsis gaditana CCMP526]|uniref:dual-specificity tyrosine- -phosphorylation regulated kinase 1b n=1 Tax=Nannochloropsis gaditana (strain CCMP526) TaxID=1093141 RepID=UPI00029F54F3